MVDEKRNDIIIDEIDFKDLVISQKTNVVQSNFLIENKPKLSKCALKMFITLIANVKKDDVKLEAIKIPVGEIIDIWGLSPKNAYTQISSALRELMLTEFPLEIISDKGERCREGFTYLTYYNYAQGEGYATVDVNHRFKPYLIDLKEKYTIYAIENISSLDTYNAIRVFELLMQYESIGKRTFTVKDFKERLNISDKYKGSNANLKKNVLDPAVDEITRQTNIIASYILEGRGEKAKITFIIRKKEDIIKKQPRNENFGKKEKKILLDLLKSEAKMDGHFSDAQIMRAIEYAIKDVNIESEITDKYKALSEAYQDFDVQAADKAEKKEYIKNKWGYYKKILEAKLQEY